VGVCVNRIGKERTLNTMRKLLVAGVAAGFSLGAVATASANDELLVMQENAAWWVMPNGNYDATRFSSLSHINADNVGDLKVA